MPLFAATLATHVLIEAPPAHVWAILANLPEWASWNPFITAMAGDLRRGARLAARMEPRGRKPMTMRPVVLEVRPGASLVWRGRLPVPGLFEGTHSFSLTAVPGGTRLDHAEAFRGLLVPFAPPEGFRADFDAMNAALKARAEAA